MGVVVVLLEGFGGGVGKVVVVICKHDPVEHDSVEFDSSSDGKTTSASGDVVEGKSVVDVTFVRLAESF